MIVQKLSQDIWVAKIVPPYINNIRQITKKWLSRVTFKIWAKIWGCLREIATIQWVKQRALPI